MNLEAVRGKLRCTACGSRRLAVRTYLEGSRLDALVLVELSDGSLDHRPGRVVQKAQVDVAGSADQPVTCRDCYCLYDDVNDLLQAPTPGGDS